jgi:uncharacterized protein DUF6600
MKKRITVIILGLMGTLSGAVTDALADLEVSAGVQIHARADFYVPLESHGAWVEVGSYGRCWHPSGVAVGWRPYCYGSWVYTDCGWYWVSDEPWAWACYHYGYWVEDPGFGWVWVPGVEWAPAWVEWRVGGGYIGWAPLVPSGIVVRHAPSTTFVFVAETRFGDPVRPSVVIINNPAIISRTTVIGGLKHDTRTIAGAEPKRVVINHGPSVAGLQKASGKAFKPMPIREVVRQTPAPNNLSGNSLKPTGRDTPRVAPERSHGAPDLQPAPSQRPDHGKDRFGRPEERPSGHGNNAGRPTSLPREHGRDKEEHGHDKGRS